MMLRELLKEYAIRIAPYYMTDPPTEEIERIMQAIESRMLTVEENRAIVNKVMNNNMDVVGDWKQAHESAEAIHAAQLERLRS
jgi:Tfp pilus assembly ATPase PilU